MTADFATYVASLTWHAAYTAEPMWQPAMAAVTDRGYRRDPFAYARSDG